MLRLSKFYSDLSEQGVILAFLGVISQEIMVEYRQLLNEARPQDEGSSYLLSSIFVEMTENILKYSAERRMHKGVERGIGIVVVSEDEDNFVVSSGNLALKEQSESVASACRRLKGLDKDAIRELYREQRRAARRGEGNGAGLGLYDIARNASGGLDFSSEEVDEEKNFISLSVKIKKQAL